jgi:hypothetical protein
MTAKPNFLIVGAAKAGTTSFARYLNQHPDIYIPENKELRYFNSEIIKRINRKDPLLKEILLTSVLNKEEYYNAFKVDAKYAGEASVHYLYHFEVTIKNVLNELGDIPIFIILRNPIERAISNWSYIMPEFNSFERSIDLEPERVANNFNAFWYYKGMGEYFTPVNHFLNSFSKVKIILFEDFIKDANSVVLDSLSFLGLPKFDQLDTSRIHNINISYLPRNNFKIALSNHKFAWFFFRVLRRFHLERFFFVEKKKNVSRSTKEKLLEYYLKDINKLEGLINRDLSEWKKIKD